MQDNMNTHCMYVNVIKIIFSQFITVQKCYYLYGKWIAMEELMSCQRNMKLTLLAGYHHNPNLLPNNFHIRKEIPCYL